jgi:hypothetical protein
MRRALAANLCPATEPGGPAAGRARGLTRPCLALRCACLCREEEGVRLEPFEEVMCEVGEEQAGAIIEALALRRGDLQDMVPLPGGRAAGPRLSGAR